MITLGQVKKVEPTAKSFVILGDFIKSDTERGTVIFSKKLLRKKTLHCKECHTEIVMRQMSRFQYGREMKYWAKFNTDGSAHVCNTWKFDIDAFEEEWINDIKSR